MNQINRAEYYKIVEAVGAADMFILLRRDRDVVSVPSLSSDHALFLLEAQALSFLFKPCFLDLGNTRLNERDFKAPNWHRLSSRKDQLFPRF